MPKIGAIERRSTREGEKMSDSSSSIIRTTVKYHEANEPNRHKPIIRIDGTTTTHYIDANDFAATVRASTDSGRDNPFRPDGEIYRSADPIVDYYKYGPNLSRAQSPIYSDLMSNGKAQLVSNGGINVKGSKKLAKLEKQKRRKEGKLRVEHDDNSASAPERKSCWRRWFCCCCRGCSRGSTTTVEREREDRSLRKKTNLEIGSGSQRDDKQAKLDARLPIVVTSQPEICLTTAATEATASSQSTRSTPSQVIASDYSTTEQRQTDSKPPLRMTNGQTNSQRKSTTLASNSSNPAKCLDDETQSTPSLSIEFVPVDLELNTNGGIQSH